MIIRRDLYLEKLIERKGNGLIKIVTGIRRCGKSFLLNNLFIEHLRTERVDDAHIIRLSLEGVANRRYRDPEFSYAYVTERIKDSQTHYIIIDEVQLMTDFVEVLNGFLQLQNVDVYVTGSNSRFLSSDIVTEFRGRGDVVRLHPLRFAEFATAYADQQEAWDDYFIYGGLPQVLTYRSKESKEAYLVDLFDTVYKRDMIDRNRLRGAENLDELLDVLASGVGSLTNPSKLEKTFRSVKNSAFSRSAIDRYISCLEDAFIVSKALRYDVKGKRYIETPYKVYFEDVGLRNARLNFRQVEENRLMENIIFNELRCRGFSVDVGLVESYSKNVDGLTVRKTHEIDFVVNRGSERYYIQSAYEIPDSEKMAQEKASLNRIGDSFKKIIVVRDYMKPRIDETGIVSVGLINFLLDDRILS